MNGLPLSSTRAKKLQKPRGGDFCEGHASDRGV